MPVRSLSLALLCLFLVSNLPRAHAQSKVSISIDLNSRIADIPADFAGLSYEMSLVNATKSGAHFFSPENHALISTFRSLGIRSLRVGGNSAERQTTPIPGRADIDSLFAFARAANVKVLYTLRISGDNAASDADIAGYILSHYGNQLTSFEIGNEPSKLFKDYESYRAAFRHYLDVISAQVPAAKFCGPASMHKDVHWSDQFARDFAGDKRVILVVQHQYPGKSGRFAVDAATAQRACQQLLRPDITNANQKLYDAFVPAVLAAHLHYRLEEANSFSNGGAAGASDAFASALWGLDYMYWWASHGCSGINFHTGANASISDQRPGMKYAVFWNSPDGYAVRPIGYALKAFSLVPPAQLVAAHVHFRGNAPNLSAYAVRSNKDAVYLILISHELAMTKPEEIDIANQHYTRAEFMPLIASTIIAQTDIQFGGSSIGSNGQWSGKWAPLLSAPSSFSLTLPPASAAVIRLSIK